MRSRYDSGNYRGEIAKLMPNAQEWYSAWSEACMLAKEVNRTLFFPSRCSPTSLTTSNSIMGAPDEDRGFPKFPWG
jgi:hypothetical protein